MAMFDHEVRPRHPDGVAAERLGLLSTRSSYVESVLRHALIADLARALWRCSPEDALQVFSADVDDAGFDIVLAVGIEVRYVQLKQCHDGKRPGDVSIRTSFAEVPGSCVVHMAHGINDLVTSAYRFLGGTPGESIGSLEGGRVSRSPGRRDNDEARKRKLRPNYRDVSIGRFSSPLSIDALLLMLFPSVRPAAA